MSGAGTDLDLSRRYKIEKILDTALKDTDNDTCDGGDTGSGLRNLFLDDVVDPDKAFETVFKMLKETNELNNAIIALSIYYKEKPDGPAYKVLWSKDYEDDFDTLLL